MNKGTVLEVVGPVVDAKFPAGKLPPIYNAITIVEPSREIDINHKAATKIGN